MKGGRANRVENLSVLNMGSEDASFGRPYRPQEEVACIPPTADGITVDPVAAVYDTGDTVNLSIINLQGTGPFTYSWLRYPDGGGTLEFSTDPAPSYVLTTADDLNEDGSGLGETQITCIITGPCGAVSPDVFIPTQIVPWPP